MVDHYTSGKSLAAFFAVNLTSKIEAIMTKVMCCRAHERSEECYMATKLFSKAKNCVSFYTVKTKDGRFVWPTVKDASQSTQ